MEARKDSGSTRVRVDKLHSFCTEALIHCGMREADAKVSADVLVTTDTWGVFTHGTNSLRDYMRRMREGGLDPRANPEIIAEGPAWAVVDGQAALGMVSSHYAMETAIRKAKSAGVGYVGVKGGSHFGAAGYYASMALTEKMIGLAISNADPNMVVPGGRGRIIGNNPLAFAAPAGEERPILMDIAMSAVAAAKVWSAKAQGKPVPDTWMADDQGVPTTDTSFWPYPGSLLPLAAHKGYGLALMVEVLAAVVTGAGLLKEIPSWHLEPTRHTNTGHAFLAIDVGALMPLDDFKRRMDAVIREIKGSPKAKGAERIYVPGEMEWERRDEALKHGILFPEAVVKNLCLAGADVGVDFGPF